MSTSDTSINTNPDGCDGTTFMKELERLSQTAPSHGIYPVTVDPRLNHVLSEKLKKADEESVLALAAELGLTPLPLPPSDGSAKSRDAGWTPTARKIRR